MQPYQPAAMAAQAHREKLVYIAKLAEKTERYNVMAETMKKVARMSQYLTIEERELFSVGCKNVAGESRAARRILSSSEQEEVTKGNWQHVEIIRECRRLVESQLACICDDILAFLNDHLIPFATPGEPSVFYNKMKGDYNRYLAEFFTGDDRNNVVQKSYMAYEAALITAESNLTPSHPIRLGLALNFSVFYYEIMNMPERACHIAKEAFYAALPEMDDPDNKSYKDSADILRLLCDNLILWTPDPLGEDLAKVNASTSGAVQD